MVSLEDEILRHGAARIVGSSCDTSADALKASDRNISYLQKRYGLGEETTHNLRCRCGHDLDRHLEVEACDAEDCPCLGFEVAWDEDDEETVWA